MPPCGCRRLAAEAFIPSVRPGCWPAISANAAIKPDGRLGDALRRAVACPTPWTKLKAASGARRILIVPMYPQYSASTTATVIDEACNWLLQPAQSAGNAVCPQFPRRPGYLDALEQSVRKHWPDNGPLAGGKDN
jgi:hypothetical protein